MIVAISIIIVVLVAFLVYIRQKYGWIDSISASHYVLTAYSNASLFYIFCWIIAIALVRVGGIIVIEHSPFGALFILAGFGMGLTATASAYRQNTVAKAHVIGAQISVWASLAGVILCFSWIPVAILGVITGILFGIDKLKWIKSRNWAYTKVYWYEIMVMITVIGSLIYGTFVILL
jgi:hypothetical protein